MGASYNPNMSTVPRGTIACWYSTIATIPSGWALCNGSNGTPDLRNQFIVCANADSGGFAKTTLLGGALRQGGSTSVTSFGDLTDGSFSLAVDEGIDNIAPGGTWGAYGSLNSTSVEVTSSQVAPPFFALAYIMKL